MNGKTLSGQARRKLTLAIHAYGRARQTLGWMLDVDAHRSAEKFLRKAEKAKAHLRAVIDELIAGGGR